MRNCDRTVSNILCQRWNETTPHEPYFLPAENDRQHNYCRNPDADVKGPWCYTTDVVKRWEYCNLTTCASPAETTSAVSTIGLETSTLQTTELASTHAATNYASVDETATAHRAISEPTHGFWYLYVIGAVIITILLTVIMLIVIMNKKRGKVPRRDAMIETNTISVYEDVPEETLQRPRENTYTEIPFFAGYLTGYNNLTASESSGKEDSVVSGSSDDTAVYQNVADGPPATYEISETGNLAKDDGQDQHATYEIPTSSTTNISPSNNSRNAESYTRPISTKPDDKRKSTDKHQADVTNDDNTAIYGITVAPKPIVHEDGYETPCIRGSGTVREATPLQKLGPLDLSTKEGAKTICISPKLIDQQWEYEGADDVNVYSTPTSPVFPMGPGNGRSYDLHTEDDYASVDESAATPDDGKDEYCTMDNASEQRKNSGKVVTLTRTYVTMHSAKAPKSLKELKKQLKLQGGHKRKTK